MAAPFSKIVTIDFETRWSRGVTEWSAEPYTLSKMTTESYIRDPRFKAFGACLHEFGPDTAKTQWYRGDELERVLRTYDWSKTALLAQNTAFDASILSWHFGVQPVMLFDTLSMARALRGPRGGNSLAVMARDFGLQPKGNAVYSTDGVYEIVPGSLMDRELAEYCVHDVFLAEALFKRFLMKFARGTDLPEDFSESDFDCVYDAANWLYPKRELLLIDMTLKMYTNPKLELDEDMLFDALKEEREKRETFLEKLSITDGQLASNDQFAELLRGIGCEPPTKKKKPTVKTPHPEGFNFAFAKTDAMFQAMLNGDDENVAMLCEARLMVKSTTERTRAQRFLDIAGRGALPVPLYYFGAGTGRWTAYDSINMQNLKRGSFLRKAIMAPKGYVIGVGDLSQIEPRVLGWLADYEELLAIFRIGVDAYATFGAQMFNMPGLNKEDNPDLRQSAKSAMLGCGYQLGWASFAAQLLVGFLGAPPVRYGMEFAKKLGVTSVYIQKFIDYDDNLVKMAEIAHTCTTKELLIHCVAAKKIIDIYRSTAHPVAGLWEKFQELIPRSLADGEEYQHKCLLFRKEEIVLPNGMSLLYPDLRQQKDEKGKPQWVYGPDATKLYAGKITNNVTQALARIVMTDGMIRTSKRYDVVGTVHDEQLDLIPEAEGKEGLKWVLGQMVVEPKYMPGIPLAADGGFHRRYGLAKK
jgi:hypothetical protein